MTMRKDLQIIKTKDKADWLAHQLLRTGGSTASALLGLNEYASAAEVFYKYIGVLPQKQVDNLPMLFGRQFEPIIRDLYQYWAGTPESMLENFAAHKKVQEVEYIDAIIVNPDYEWLHANVDGIIKSNYEGREGILEIKTISSFSSDKYEGSVPPAYVIQCHVYMIILEMDYAEIAVLKDGRNFDVLPIEYSQNIATQIIERTKDFWQRVNEAKKIMASDLSQEQKLALVAEYEPEVENTAAYESFLKERFRNVAEGAMPIEGTQEQWELALKYETILKPQLKQTEEEMRHVTNTLKRAFEDRDTISFDHGGNITYRQDKRGIRSLRFNLKF